MIPAAPADTHRPTLTLCFQEALTLIARLSPYLPDRFADYRRRVTDPGTFRAQFLDLLDEAQRLGRSAGHAEKDLSLAKYAVVALLDEVVMTSGLPVFAEWKRQTLQLELYQTQIAGENFFHHFREIMRRTESPATADLLEIHLACLSLGFRGKYTADELNLTMPMVLEKINRIRSGQREISPDWRPSSKAVVPARLSSWRSSWALAAAVATGLVAILLFVVFGVLLRLGTDEAQRMAGFK
jgi:type IV/VI secretion system ImpK/VasF family protein